MSAIAPSPRYGILIVEDETIVALDLRLRLEAHGYGVTALATTGAEAIASVRDAKPDLVLMDIKLKGDMDGIKTAELIRAESDTPVVFVTAFTDESTLDRAKRVSPYGYIVKPYHDRELRIAIELALYKHDYERSMMQTVEASESASKLKTIFLSNISHELKTPLNSIMGFTELALDRADDPETRDCVLMIKQGAVSLRYLIDSILEFTALEEGTLGPLSTVCDIRDAVLSALVTNAPASFDKGIELSWYVDPDVPDRIRTDDGKFRKAIYAVVENAVKYTSEGFIRVCVGLAHDGGEPRVVVRVEDTGIGISEANRGRLFSAFTQIDGAITRPAGGLGLGLAFVKKLLAVIDSEIWHEDRPGGGSVFAISLPYDQSTAVFSERPKACRTACLVGFAEPLAGDLHRTLADRGAHVERVECLDEVIGLPHDDGTVFFVDETEAERYCLEMSAGSQTPSFDGLPERLVTGCRIGRNQRSALESYSFPSLYYPMPFDDSLLSNAVACAGFRKNERSKIPANARPAAEAGSTATATATERPASDTKVDGGSSAMHGGAPSDEPATTVPDESKAERDEEESTEFRAFAESVMPAIRRLDWSGIERNAKEYWNHRPRDKAHPCSTMAFELMLAARRSDRKAVQNLEERIKRVL